MNIYLFSFLEREQQEYIISEQGIFLATMEKDGLIFDLYQLESFYVEFFYYLHDNEKIIVRCFNSPDELRPYLGLIDIDGLL